MSTGARWTLAVLLAWVVGLFLVPRDLFPSWGALPWTLVLVGCLVAALFPLVGWVLRTLRL